MGLMGVDKGFGKGLGWKMEVGEGVCGRMRQGVGDLFTPPAVQGFDMSAYWPPPPTPPLY